MVLIVSVAIAVFAFLAWRAGKKAAELSRLPGSRSVPAVFAFIGVLALLVGASQVFTVIPAGHVGVIDFFGTVSSTTLKSGVNTVNPLARVVKFSIKTEEIKEVMDVPSKEGLTVQLELSCLFHLDPEKANEVYRMVGPNYRDVILIPQFRSVARGVTAGYEAKALYTSERETLTQEIKRDLERVVGPKGIVVESTPLRRVGLPPGLTQSIEEKLRAEQDSQRMQFVLTKEKLEADRKRIEAQGVADFQKIVATGINDQLLRWKGIEATEKLASSANAKIVVIGSGKDGLPLILNSQ